LLPDDMTVLHAEPSQRRRELLFDFRRGDALIRCELIDHGEEYGVQALFLDDGFPISRRMFPPWRNPQQTSRTMAIIWSEAERTALERILPVITAKERSADHGPTRR
jgi:hypothetical protein